MLYRSLIISYARALGSHECPKARLTRHSSLDQLMLVLLRSPKINPPQTRPEAPVRPAASQAKAVSRSKTGQGRHSIRRIHNCERKLVEPFFGRLEDGPAIPDRWRIVQTLGYKEQIQPYAAHNLLKGDLPVFGKDWFFSITGVSDSLVEPRRFPLPVGVATTTGLDATI